MFADWRARVFGDSRLHILHTGAIPAGYTCLLTSMDSALWAPPTSQTTMSYVLPPSPVLIPTSVTARMLTWINGVHAMHTYTHAAEIRTKRRSPALGLGLGRVLERIADLQGQARVLGVEPKIRCGDFAHLRV